MSLRDVVLLVSLCSALSGERLALKVYTTAEGLPDNTARPLLASSRGYLWAASGSTLVRFDGHSFRTFSAADGWTGGRAFSMIETASAEYYVSAAQGVFRFDPEAPVDRRFTLVRLPEPISEVPQVLEDSQRRLWVSGEEGAFRRDPTGGANWHRLTAVRPVQPQHQARVEHFAEDHWGDVWVTSYSGIYCFRRDGSVERYSKGDHPQLNDSGIAILEGPDRKIYAGTESGLFRFVRREARQRAVVDRAWLLKDGLPSLYVAALAFWKGQLWVGTFRGLARIDDRGRVEAHTELAGVKEAPVESLLVDRTGALWVGTDGAGLWMAVNRGFTNFTEKDGLAFPRIEQVLEDRNGELLAVSKSERMLALNRWNGEDRFFAHRPRFPAGIAFPWAWSQIALHTRAGDWWFGSTPGPVTFHAPTLKALQAAPAVIGPTWAPAARGYVFRLFEDSRGGVWMSIAGLINYLLYWDPVNRQWHRFGSAEGFTGGFDNQVAAFAEDASGNIWMGCLARGLYRFRAGKLETIRARSGDQAGGQAGDRDSAPRSLHVDESGRLWIGTKDAGILRVDDPNAARPVFARYQISQGLSSDSTFCLTSDRHGDIYICTSRGIDRLQPSTGRIRTYTPADGLIAGALRAAFRDRHGALWFGTTEGVSRFVPPGPHTPATGSPATGSPVVIQGLRAARRPVSVSAFGVSRFEGLRLETNEQRLQVDYVAFDLRARYQHRLQGINEWSAPSDERSVLLEGLAPGGYRFEVRAISEEGFVSREPATVGFYVVPPVWRRWWFLLLMAAALCAVAYALHRYQLNQVLALERVRLRIASDLHDDIGSSLSQVSMLGELARRSLDGANPRAVELIERMASASREAVAAMGDIVWSIHPRNDRLSDLVQRMRGFASDVLSARDIHLDFLVPPAEAALALPLEMRRDLLLIFKESVNNAARHSGCGRVRVELRIMGKNLLMTVEDNGCGFDPSEENRGYGLRTIQARARKLGGSCEVRRVGGVAAGADGGPGCGSGRGTGSGTVVVVSLPMTVPYLSR